MMYSDKVMDHFQNPRNVGIIKDADGVGEVGNPVCGDMMAFYIKVKDNRLVDIKFQTFGCGAAIAVSSMVSEMAMGKTLQEAKQITNETVAEELGGLPKNKLHCSNLGADALHKAIEDFENKEKGKEVKTAPQAAPAHEEEGCCCPYCDGALEDLEDYCTKCQVELEDCPECGKLTNKADEKCSHCGASLATV
jgi:nitrogen fixation protein NifU and related proteins